MDELAMRKLLALIKEHGTTAAIRPLESSRGFQLRLGDTVVTIKHYGYYDNAWLEVEFVKPDDLPWIT